MDKKLMCSGDDSIMCADGRLKHGRRLCGCSCSLLLTTHQENHRELICTDIRSDFLAIRASCYSVFALFSFVLMTND